MIAGTIIDFAGTSLPADYVACDGSAYSATALPDLYAAIGNSWDTFRGQAAPGAGMFRVPLLNGLVLVATGPVATNPATSLRNFQDVLGEEQHTLITSELSGHTHGVTDPGHAHQTQNGYNILTQYPANNGYQTSPSLVAGQIFVQPSSYETTSQATGVTITNSGGDQPHNNIQPSVCIQKLIKTSN